MEDVAEVLECAISTLHKYETSCDRGFNFVLVKRLADAYNTTITNIVYACNNVNVPNNLKAQPYDDANKAINLKDMRLQTNLTIKEVCTMLNIRRETLFKYEKAIIKPNSKIIYKMHIAYNKSCEDIVAACFKTFENKI